MIAGEDLTQILSRMSLEFYTKVLEYYSSLQMKYLRRLFSVCRPLIDYLLECSVAVEESLKQHLHNLVEGVFNIQLTVIKVAMEKVIQLLNLKKLEYSLSFYRFRSYVGLF